MTRLAIVCIAIGFAIIPLPPRFVELIYSGQLYPVWQAPLTTLSNQVPIALFDVFLITAIGWWLIAAVRDVRRAGIRAFAAIAVRTVVLCAAAYLAFAILWGLNYRRERLAEKLTLDRSPISSDVVRARTLDTAAQLNRLAADAHRLGWPDGGAIDPALHDGFSRTVRAIGSTVPAVARPKHTLLDWYFRRAGVDGMTDPYFLETLVVSDLLPLERPLVVAHEWAHLAGVADEGEANFVGWLACMHGSVADQYSGALFLYQELAASLGGRDRAAIAATLGDTPRQDLAAIRARVTRNLSPAISTVAWRTYDSYLKSNRVAAGARSYGEVVDLVIRTRLDANGLPESSRRSPR